MQKQILGLFSSIKTGSCKFGMQQLYQPEQAIIPQARQRVPGWAVECNSDVAEGHP